MKACAVLVSPHVPLLVIGTMRAPGTAVVNGLRLICLGLNCLPSERCAYPVVPLLDTCMPLRIVYYDEALPIALLLDTLPQ